jgi:cytochrome c biogenesis protein
VWLTPNESATETHASMALSSNRKTMDGDREFVRLTERLIGAKPDVKPDLKESVKAE